MIRLAIVDDDALVRTGLRLILGGETDIHIVSEAANGVEAEKLAGDVDVMLMDIRMPVQDGITTTEKLMAHPPAPAIIVLTTFEADDLVLRALGAGAAGFLLKDTSPARLIAAIHAVAAGEPMLSPTITRRLIAAATSTTATALLDSAASASLATLTDREREVAIQIAHGLPNAEIATHLFMSVATVKATITHIFQKIDTTNRVQLAIMVRNAGLL
ncbi:DNA-binding response regulator [Cryobacterium melibiosiphilum]|uniref:DNA-binding response regulator n=2 Tax=Cryobacterium TaxID=69578 RepID=A0A3A5MT42_9MICO|nr:response regulator transcription factor [Cryobacterium melibiosiphilum]RJT92165.1 DNA-binding response regulator [Cryobacterium melibiosiphilum]